MCRNIYFIDTTEEDIHVEDLQLHTVYNRERYTTALKRLLERWSKYSVKALVRNLII